MKNKIIIFSSFAATILTIGTGCLITSCDNWTETENVGYEVTTPEDQNPELYARYTQAVRNYKDHKHYAVCARFDNGRSGDGEKDFLRSMPDSLDAIILEHAETLNTADLEDIPVLQRDFATKILFNFDLTSMKDNAESSGKNINELLVPALDKMVAVISDNGLDGACISYSGDIGLGNNATINASIAEMRQLLLDKITPLAKAGKTFFMEGNPLFIPEANRDVFTSYVLKTTSATTASQLRLIVNEALYYANIPSNKLLITSDPELIVTDNSTNLVSQVPFFAVQVIDCGPVGGLIIQNVSADYSHPGNTYQETRNAIQTLNPSPLK